MSKKIVLIDYDKKRQLGNQLWNIASIMAFCIEHNCQFEHQGFFVKNYYKKIGINTGNWLVKLLFFNRYSDSYLYLKLKPFRIYKSILKILCKNSFLDSTSGIISLDSKEFMRFYNQQDKIYLDGWLYRFEKGLIKYRNEIISKLNFDKGIVNDAHSLITALRSGFKHIIGVHWRQKDFRHFRNGEFYFTVTDLNRQMSSMLKAKKWGKDETLFVVCSDEKINRNDFKNLNIEAGNPNDFLFDLICLSLTDIILATPSTYSAFSAYMGNVPLVLLDRKKNVISNRKTFSFQMLPGLVYGR